MKPLLVVLALTLAACGSSEEAVRAPVEAMRASTPPTVMLLHDGTRGGVMMVSFRSDAAVALSDTAGAHVDLGGTVLHARLHAGPARQADGREVTITQASYRLDPASMAALAKAGPNARLVVMVGGERREYPFVRADRLE